MRNVKKVLQKKKKKIVVNENSKHVDGILIDVVTALTYLVKHRFVSFLLDRAFERQKRNEMEWKRKSGKENARRKVGGAYA